jgi:hypothetical protein
MAEPIVATIRSVTFHPVLNGGDPIDIPVSIDLTFKNGPTLTYDTSLESKTYKVEPFQLSIEDFSEVSGKLYAIDRQRNSGYYFTLHPTTMPHYSTSEIHIFVSIMGPAICWALSVTTLEDDIKEPERD